VHPQITLHSVQVLLKRYWQEWWGHIGMRGCSAVEVQSEKFETACTLSFETVDQNLSRLQCICLKRSLYVLHRVRMVAVSMLTDFRRQENKLHIILRERRYFAIRFNLDYEIDKLQTILNLAEDLCPPFSAHVVLQVT
jgi:hypothetical protein